MPVAVGSVRCAKIFSWLLDSSPLRCSAAQKYLRFHHGYQPVVAVWRAIGTNSQLVFSSFGRFWQVVVAKARNRPHRRINGQMNRWSMARAGGMAKPATAQPPFYFHRVHVPVVLTTVAAAARAAAATAALSP